MPGRRTADDKGVPKPPASPVIRELRHFGKLIGRTLLFVYVPLIIVLVFLHYPYDTDVSQRASMQPDRPASTANFYEAAYTKADGKKRGVDYEATAAEAAQAADIKGQVSRFIKKYQLQDARVLDIGSGRGYLQDMVANYTGLDLSPTVAPKYHKPFVVGSATEMPFPNDSFDAAWTVWVVEHIPEPEKAFAEMRRVIKPGGHLLLIVAWNCAPWFADGFEVRPYEDFNLAGKLVKASIPLRTTRLFDSAHRIPTRLLRWAHYAASGSDTHLRYRALQANYNTYWRPDSDAAISLDAYETMLWFQSRGDECLNCESRASELVQEPKTLMIRVNKAPSPSRPAPSNASLR